MISRLISFIGKQILGMDKAATSVPHTDLIAKANALATAWPLALNSPAPNRQAIRLTLAQAYHETRAGDAWENCFNWGAVDYRTCNAHEVTSIAAGELSDGNWLYTDGTWGVEHKPNTVAQLHTDTHADGARFHIWFCAFNDDVDGAAHFLKTVWRMANDVLIKPGATTTDYATAVYLHYYFEGTHPGRPWGQRRLPLTPTELLNVQDYVKALDACLVTIDAALVGWSLPAVTLPVAPGTPPAGAG